MLPAPVKSTLAPFLLLFLAGCSIFSTADSVPSPGSTNVTPNFVGVPTEVGALEGLLLTTNPSYPLPISTPVPSSPTPRPLSSTPLPTASKQPPLPSPQAPTLPTSLALLSPANISSLQKIAEIHFTPWELVMALAWSGDGLRLAVAAGENVHVFDGQSLQEVQVLQVGAWAGGLAFEPGGDKGYVLALAARDGSIQVWDAADGRRLCRFDGHTRGANSLAFSPDGRFLATTGNDGFIRLWESSKWSVEGECPRAPAAEMIGGAFAVSDVEFSPHGDRIASASSDFIHLRDPVTQRLVRTLYSEESIFSLAYSPDGKTLASAEVGGVARLWDVETGQQIASLGRSAGDTVPPGVFLWSVDYNPDGRLLAGGSSDGLLLLWDLTAQPARSLALLAHTRGVACLAFSPDGLRLATGGLDGAVLIWGAR